MFELFQILKKDNKILYFLKARIFEALSENGIVELHNICHANRNYDERDLIAMVLILEKMGVLYSIDETHVPITQRRLGVNIEMLQLLSIEIEAIRKYIGNADRNKSYGLMATIPKPKKVTKQYTRIRSQVKPVYETILSLIANSNNEIIIISPFLNEKGLELIESELLIRMKSGVKVEIITRYVSRDDKNYSLLGEFLHKTKSLDLLGILHIYEYRLDRKEPNESVTFHAKAMIVDKGEKAYLGSANFTGWGLDDQFELGVVIEDENSLILYDIVEYMKQENIIKEIMF